MTLQQQQQLQEQQAKWAKLPPKEKLQQIALTEQQTEINASNARAQFRAQCQSQRDIALCEYVDQLFKKFQDAATGPGRGLSHGATPTVETATPAQSQQSTPKPCEPTTPQQFQNWKDRPAPQGSAVDVHGQLSIKGNQLVDKNGQPVTLLGSSLFWSQWMGKFYNAKTVQNLTKWNVNLIRIAMAADERFPEGYLSNAEAEKKKVHDVVKACVEAGIYCIIDWHTEGSSNEDKAKEFFSQMAKDYGKLPNVMFETFNEPISADGKSYDANPKDYWNNTLKHYHERVVDVIRAHSDNVCILGTPNWSHNPDVASWNPVQGKNLAYTVHFYAASDFDHGAVEEALKNNCAVVCTEWGMDNNQAKGALDYQSTKNWMNFFKQHNISSANWAVSDKDADGETASALKHGTSENADWSDADLSPSGTWVLNYIKKNNQNTGNAGLVKVIGA